MSKKSRKRNKKILSALLLGGLGLAAANKKGKASTNADAVKAMTSNDAYSDDTMPSNLSSNMGMKRKQFMPGIVDYMAKGGRAGHKSGGKVKGCGKALRGFGKAMKKGKK